VPDTNIYYYNIPDSLGDGFTVAHANDVNFPVNMLDTMIGYVNSIPDHEIHSILVMKDNTLILEHYFVGKVFTSSPPGLGYQSIQYNREVLQFMASVTKSFTSVAAGVAYDNGFLPDPETKIYTIYPEFADIFTEDKRKITIQHLLEMTSGLAYDEDTYPFGHPENDVTKMFNARDPIEYLLSKQLTSQPGDRFYYNSGSANILADIVSRGAGMTFFQFCRTYFLDKMDIDNIVLERFGNGDYFASGGLHLGARDLLKFGYLMLNDGVWNGKRIISSEWASKSVQHYSTPIGWPYANGYGYQWWLHEVTVNGKAFKLYYAAGWGNQFMFVVPAENLIAIFTAGHFENAPVSPVNLFNNYILAGLTE
jgi:CubicO group peptidase (beta-lactamase class C family)